MQNKIIKALKLPPNPTFKDMFQSHLSKKTTVLRDQEMYMYVFQCHKLITLRQYTVSTAYYIPHHNTLGMRFTHTLSIYVSSALTETIRMYLA